MNVIFSIKVLILFTFKMSTLLCLAYRDTISRLRSNCCGRGRVVSISRNPIFMHTTKRVWGGGMPCVLNGLQLIIKYLINRGLG